VVIGTNYSVFVVVELDDNCPLDNEAKHKVDHGGQEEVLRNEDLW